MNQFHFYHIRLRERQSLHPSYWSNLAGAGINLAETDKHSEVQFIFLMLEILSNSYSHSKLYYHAGEMRLPAGHWNIFVIPRLRVDVYIFTYICVYIIYKSQISDEKFLNFLPLLTRET